MRMLAGVLVGTLTALLSSAVAANEYSAATHRVFTGDFNGDTRDDLLYVARSASGSSGIIFASLGGALDIAGPTWPSNHLGIPWFDEIYTPHVGDFNGDNRDDLLLQGSTPGDHYLLLANSAGQFPVITQTIPNAQAGVDWSRLAHRLVVGDFNGDTRDDVFLQGTSPGNVHAVVLADGGGQFTSTTPYQSWSDGYLGFAWSLTKAVVHAGRFNADVRDDLLIQAKPDIILIDYDVPIPVPRFRPNSFGLVLALDPAGGGVFRSGSVHQFWSRNALGADWSAMHTNVIIGDFNGDGRDDAFLQSKNGTRANSMHFVDAAGQFTQTNGIAGGTLPTAYGTQYRIVAGNFDGTGAVGLYLQGTNSSIANLVTQDPGVGGVVVTHNIGSISPVTAGTAPGSIPGEFSVDPSGTANYRIPIVLPPGVAGVDPELAIAYSSRGGNGLLGVGFDLSGFSAITRCPATWLPDGVNDGVDFDGNDRFCLDGQRLMQISAGAYGAMGAEYRTELESFQKVVAVGGTAGDPGHFVVHDKAGLRREYGATPAGRVLAHGIGQALTWNVTRISDRFNNYIAFDYAQTATLSHARPSVVSYGSRVGGQDREVGRVAFAYESRGDTGSGYLAGAVVGFDQRLVRIDVYARASQAATTGANTLVRAYYLNYAVDAVTQQSQIAEIIQCDGLSRGSQRCLGSTKFAWQVGYRGFSDAVNTGVGASGWNWANTKIVDVNADGRLDVLWRSGSGNWEWRFGGIDGTYGLSSTAFRTPADAVVLDYNNDGYQDVLQYGINNSMLEVVLGGADGMGSATPVGVAGTRLSTGSMLTAVADADGDGQQDLAWLAGNRNLEFILNSGSGLSETNMRSAALTGALWGGGGGTTVEQYVEYTASGNDPRLYAVNFDGGGDDLVVRSRACRYYELPQGDQFATSCGNTGLRVYRWNPSLTPARYEFAGFYALASTAKIKPTDVNGDGITDFFVSTGSTWTTVIGTGNPAAPFVQGWDAAQITYSQRIDLNWGVFNLGQNGATGVEVQVTVNLSQTLWDQAQIFDYDRNGRADVLVPVNGTWRAMLSNGQGYNTTILDTGRSSANAAQTVVFDNRSDGLPDLMWPEGGTHRLLYHRGPVSGLLTGITDGLGAKTSVQYAVMTDGDAYKGTQPVTETAAAPVFPLQHFAAPIPLVFKIATDNGRGGVPNVPVGAVLTQYEYRGMKLHRQGRGWTGFSEVKSWNDNTALVTTNRFFQTWPYVGMVSTTEQRFPDITTVNGYLTGDSAPDLALTYQQACETDPLNCSGIWPVSLSTVQGNAVTWSTSTVNQLALGNGRVFPYVASTDERKYPVLPSGSQPNAYQRTVTQYTGVNGVGHGYDSDGNAIEIRVTVDDGAGGDLHRVVTTNSYLAANYTDWCLGRLSRSEAVHTRANYANGNTALVTLPARVATFEYLTGSQCVLWKEHTEPGTGQALTKTYGYDAFGNRTSVQTSGSGLVTRTASTQYDVAGQLPVSLTNALGHPETHEYDTRFGQQTRLVGPNALQSDWAYDSFGRKVEERVPGTNGQLVTRTEYYWCRGFVGCDARAVLATRVTGPDGSFAWSELDRLGREVRTRQVAFNGTETISEAWYDPLGRKYLTVAPYFGSQSQCWSFSTFDQVGRTSATWSPASQAECTTGRAADGSPRAFDAGVPAGGRRTNFEYDLIRADGVAVRATLTAAGAPTRVTLKSYNRMERLRFVRDALNGNLCTTSGPDCITQEFDYDPVGNTSLVRDAKGATTHITYNHRGFKTQMQDPNMGTWNYTYDGLGQLLTQSDAKGQTTTLTYDVLGRLQTRTEGAEGTTNWYYDEGAPTQKTRGKLTRVVAPGFEEHYQYDTLGRLHQTRRLVDGVWLWADTTYDALNRVDTIKYPNSVSSSSSSSPGADADRFRVRHTYNAWGYLQAVQEVTPGGGTGTTYWQANTVNEAGVVTREDLGNGLSTLRTVDRATGNLTALSTGVGLATDVQHMAFEWDGAGNLTMRRDHRARSTGGAREEFYYDGLHRLSTVRRFNGATGAYGATGWVAQESHGYDEVGNILNKGVVTAYNYTTNGSCTRTWTHLQPHAVRQVTANGQTRQYCYDANGNVTSATNATFQSITWSVANLARLITRSGTESSEFWYDPNRARYKHVARFGSTTETTLYMGALYERKQVGAAIEHVHYVRDGNDTVAVVRRTQGSTTNAVKYLHRDHLGSVVAATDPNRAVLERMAYDAWGKRRADSSWSTPPAGSFINRSTTTHGPIPAERRAYTGHEQLDTVGLVHMNARIYDPELGRFLSADPTVQFPESTQGFNRYTYTGNNPLTYYDPSGFSFWKKVMKVVGIAMTIWAPQFTHVWQNMLWGFASGMLSSGGNVRTGLISGITAGFSVRIGKLEELNKFQRAALHGLVGGAASVAAGGRFGEGFLSSFVSKWGMESVEELDAFERFMGRVGDGDPLGIAARTTIAATVGGTVSFAAGGSFANGARTAAIQHLFNGEGRAARLRKAYDTSEGGHHYFPFEEWPDDLSEEARVVFGREATGPLRHTRDRAHIQYGKAVRQMFDDLKIDPATMTTDQAKVFVRSVQNSGVGAVGGYLDKIGDPNRRGIKLRGVGALGIAVGIVPLILDRQYTWKDYVGDSMCGVMLGCGDAQ